MFHICSDPDCKKSLPIDPLSPPLPRVRKIPLSYQIQSFNKENQGKFSLFESQQRNFHLWPNKIIFLFLLLK